jgi:hypothetical protein
MKGYHGLPRASTLKEQIVAGIVTITIIYFSGIVK